MLKKMLSGDEEISDYFSRPELLGILKDHYSTSDEKVVVKLHRYVKENS